jgi:hypothetical protein
MYLQKALIFKLLPLFFKLTIVKPGIETLFLKQLVMFALLNYGAILQNQYYIGFSDS